MATTRLEIRLDEKIKAKAEKASALLGEKSLTSYLINLMNEDASKVIARYASMKLENDIFDRFMNACDKASKPNKALEDALAFTKKQGIK